MWSEDECAYVSKNLNSSNATYTHHSYPTMNSGNVSPPSGGVVCDGGRITFTASGFSDGTGSWSDGECTQNVTYTATISGDSTKTVTMDFPATVYAGSSYPVSVTFNYTYEHPVNGTTNASRTVTAYYQRKVGCGFDDDSGDSGSGDNGGGDNGGGGSGDNGDNGGGGEDPDDDLSDPDPDPYDPFDPDDPDGLDTDGDGIPDGIEEQYPCLDPLSDDAGLDSDGDGYTNYQELLFELNPMLPDECGLAYPPHPDGFCESIRNPCVAYEGPDPDPDPETDPDPDPDEDGIPTTLELLFDCMDPHRGDAGYDFDLDGVSNYEEIMIHNLNPCNPDYDGDGLPDGWEIEHGFDPMDWEDPLTDSNLADNPDADADSEGLININEFAFGGDPNLANSDSGLLVDIDSLVPLTVGAPQIIVPLPGEGQEVFDAESGYPFLDPKTYDETLPLFFLPYRAPSGAYDYNGDGITDATDIEPPASVVVLGADGLPVPDPSVNPGFYYFDPATASPHVSTLYPEEYYDVPQQTMLPYVYPEGHTRLSDPLDNARELVEWVTLSLGGQPVLDSQGAPVQFERLKFVPGVGTYAPDPVTIALFENDGGMDDLWEALAGMDPMYPEDATQPALGRLGLNNIALFVFESQLSADQDGDFIPDLLEQGSNLGDSPPGFGTEATIVDSDGDTIPDGYEVFAGLDPTTADGAEDDLDRDGISNVDEFNLGLLPFYGDSDLDGLPDKWEVDNSVDPNSVITETLSATDLSQGMTLWWNFERISSSRDGVVLDDSLFDGTRVPTDARLRGNNLRIAYYGSPVLTQGRHVSINSLSNPFDAAYMLAPDATALDLGQSDFTLAFWFQWRPETVREISVLTNMFADERLVFSKAGAYSATAQYVGFGGEVELTFAFEGIAENVSVVLPDYIWSHVGVTFDATSSQLSIYNDGVLVEQVTLTTGSIVNSQEPLIIGSPGEVPSRLLNMSLDDWRIYDRILTSDEFSQLSDPDSLLWDQNKDRDGDGLTELIEFRYGFSPFEANIDTDEDGILDILEINGYVIDDDGLPIAPSPSQWPVYKTDPRLWDHDGDGLSDLEEIQGIMSVVKLTHANGVPESYNRIITTDPDTRDSDGDGLDDRLEREVYFTDPAHEDTDRDGIQDGFELANGLNPNDFRDSEGEFVGDPLGDLDGDGISNLEEYQDNSRKVTENEERLELSSLDSDLDGLTDLEEVELGLDPENEDTDGDTMSDAFELSNNFDPLDNLNPEDDTNPDDNADADPDFDGRTNAQEEADATNPNDLENRTIQIAAARTISKTKEVPSDATDEEKIDEFHRQTYRVFYPEGSGSGAAYVAGGEALQPFGILEKMTLSGQTPDGASVEIQLGASAIENSFTSDDLGSELPKQSFGPARSVGSFLDSLQRDENGYVSITVVFASTANLKDEEEEEGPDPGDETSSPQVGQSTGSFAGGSGGGYGGGGNWSGLYGQRATLEPSPQTEPEPEEEQKEQFKAKANSRVVLYVETESPCDQSGGSSSIENSSVDIQIGLGESIRGLNPGSLRIKADVPSASLYSPDELLYVCDIGLDVDVIREGAAIRQILTEQKLVDVEVVDAHSYTISFYDAAGIEEADEDTGLYTPDGLPVRVWTIQDLDSGTNNSYKLSVSDSNGSSSTEYLYTWKPENQDWTLTSAGLKEVGRKELVSGNLRTEVYWVSTPGGAVVSKEETVYQTFPWGEEKVEHTLDPDSTSGGLTTTWAYYDNQLVDGVGNYGRLKSVLRSDGGWSEYQYDQSGRVIKQTQPIGNAILGAPDTLCRVVATQYQATSPQVTRVETTLGVETSRQYTVRDGNTTYQISAVTPGAPWDAPDNLITETQTVGGSGEFRDRVAFRLTPDGQMTLSTYERDQSDGSLTVITETGVPDVDYLTVVDGVRQTIVRDALGELISQTSVDIATDTTISSEVVLASDVSGKPSILGYADGTTVQRTYTELDCGCGPAKLKSEIDQRGIETTYTYDQLGRRTSVTRLGVTEEYVHDASGRVVQRKRIAGGTTQIIEETDYDLAGRTTERRALGANTDGSLIPKSTTYSVAAEGGRVLTSTYANGGTEVRTAYRDGSIEQVSGTAVNAMRYEKRVEGDALVTRAILVDDGSDTLEWVETWDVMGRTEKTVYPDGAQSLQFYDSAGRLEKTVDPDGVVNLYAYNSKGERYQTAVDVNQNDEIDDIANTADRVSERATFFTTRTYEGETYAVYRSESFQWTESGRVSVSISDRTPDGKHVWNERFGSIAYTFTEDANTTDGDWKVTSVAPDGSYNVQTYTDGRMSDTTSYDSTGAQLASTTILFDALGRQEYITDSRTGTTQITYYDNDAVASRIAPDPDGDTLDTQGSVVQHPDGDGTHDPLETTFIYDDMGRQTQVILPDATSTYTEYNAKGQVVKTYGSQQNPVEYTYDYAGRQKTMTTWQDFDVSTGFGISGDATTTWIYDNQRGWLDRKEYPAVAPDPAYGTDYTYTPGGRLASRTWARGIDTLYAYNSAGDILAVDYDDAGATPDIHYTYARTGQQDAVSEGQYATAAFSAGDIFTPSLSPSLSTSVRSIDHDYNDRFQVQLETITGLLANDKELVRTYVESGSTVGRNAGYIFGELLATTANPLGASDFATTHSVVDYGYDAAGRLETVTDGTDTFTYGYLADTRNLLETVTGPVHDVTYAYEPGRNAMTLVDNQLLGGTTSVSSYAYAYNALGQRSERSQGGDEIANTSTDSFHYDGLGQVDFVENDYYTSSDYEPDYSFDMIGNRTGDTVDLNGTTSYTQDLLNQYTAVGAASPIYDEDGNLTADGTWTYTWNGENRLVNADNGSISIDFAYDYQGRLVEKDDGTAVVVYFYDRWNRIAEYVNGSLSSTNLWGIDLSGSSQGAGGVGGLLKEGSRYPTYDANGNIVQKLNSSGGTDMAVVYDPFGNIISGTLVGEYGFSTKPMISDIQWYYYGFRYYDPVTGRWPSRDPIGEIGSLTWFARRAFVEAKLLSISNSLISAGVDGEQYSLIMSRLKEGGLKWLSRPSETLSGSGIYSFVFNDSINGVDVLGLADLSGFSCEQLNETLEGVQGGQELAADVAESGEYDAVSDAVDSGDAEVATPVTGSSDPVIDAFESDWSDTAAGLGMHILGQAANAVDGLFLDEPGNFYNYWGMIEVWRHQQLIDQIEEELEGRGEDCDCSSEE